MRYFSFTATLHFLRYLHHYAIALLVFVPAVVVALIDPPPKPTITQSNEPYSIIVLPDTQYYSSLYPATFLSQTQWIAEQARTLNIKFAIQLGDIVDLPNSRDQWLVADAAMAKLDNKVPYSVLPGNHDKEQDGSSPMYSKTFPSSRFRNGPTWGGTYFDPKNTVNQSENKNNYHELEVGNEKFLIINFEFCPSNDVLAWADNLIKQNQDRHTIINTHTFLTTSNERSAVTECNKYSAAVGNAGEDIWSKLITKNPNIRLILSAHDNTDPEGAARRSDIVGGKPVHQLHSNYQHLGRGGDGYLRIMTFYPDVKKIKVATYSPYLDTFRSDPENNFELSY